MKKKLIVLVENMRDFPAVINAGADEVVVALDGYCFSAAQTMKKEEVESLLSFAKSFNKEVSLLVNRIFHEDDLHEIDTLMQWVKDTDIANMYFGDLAIAMGAKKENIPQHLFYMPDTLVTSIADVTFWGEQSISSVISPLLTIEETLEIARATQQAVVWVHGRSIMSRSYRPLLTAWKQEYGYTGEVVKNHQLTISEEKRDGKMPVYEDENGTLIYTDYVLNSFVEMNDLMDSGLYGFFMSGLFETREDYLQAIHAYRSILDGKDASVVGKEYEEATKQVISSGYYHEKTVR